MKIIEGKVGKSRELEKILLSEEYKDKDILLIDTVNVMVLHDLDNIKNGWLIKDNKELFNNIDEIISEIQNKKYDVVVFEVNDIKDMIITYFDIENTIKLPVIITIQNNDLGKNIEIYDM